MQEIIGEVAEIIYKNEGNSYTVCVIESAQEDFTAVGYLPFLNEGETVKIYGDFVNHSDYGRQFKITTFEKYMPEGISAIEKYLASGIIKGIGKATAKKIVKKFGEATLDVIRNMPEKLIEVKGINEERALNISRTLNEQWELWQVTSFLGKYGIGSKNVAKLYKSFGESTLDVIKDNPYIILELGRGVEFKTVDEIAKDLGLDVIDDKRVASGIKYILNNSTMNGHTYVPIDILQAHCCDFLEVEEEAFKNGLTKLLLEAKVKNDDDRIYLSSLYVAERNVAIKLFNMACCENSCGELNINKNLENGVELTEEQVSTIDSVLKNRVSFITGGPGTGKTTIVSGIIETAIGAGQEVVLCAPTGRAAKRMSEATGYEAKTIHRLLEINHIDDDDRSAMVNVDVSIIDADVVIVDEVSMIDIILMNNLLKAVKDTTTLILVGDFDQLPSVGPGNVLKDIIESEKIKVLKLTQIFRQASESMIVVNAHRINSGETPEFNKENGDCFFVRARTYDEIVNNVLSLTMDRLPHFGEYNSIDDIQVITPMRKGTLGANNLNKELQKVINPFSKTKAQVESGSRIFRVGDKVMQIKNNYDLLWWKEHESGTGIYNGDMGRIKIVNTLDEFVEVEFDDGKSAEYDFSQLEELDLAYATTVHKSQGSEFKVVVLPIFEGASRLMTKNLLYTAITRARELLVLVGSQNAIVSMINNSTKNNRYSALKEMLIKLDEI